MISFAIMCAALLVVGIYFGLIAANYLELKKARKELQKALESEEIGKAEQ